MIANDFLRLEVNECHELKGCHQLGSWKPQIVGLYQCRRKNTVRVLTVTISA